MVSLGFSIDSRKLISISPGQNPSSQTNNLWKKTYENLTKWHTHHQVLYWKGLAESFQHQNQQLLLRLQQIEPTENDEEESDEDSEQSESESSLSDEEPDTTIIQNHLELEIDEEYLIFLEETRNHREEMKLKATATSQSPDDTC